MDIDQAIRLARESIRAGNLSEDWREVRGGLDHAIAIDTVCAELEKFRAERTLKVADMVPEVKESDHVVDWSWIPSKNEVVFSCSCGAGWNMFTRGPVTEIAPKIQEGIKSHLISVGIKPSEVL